MQGGIESAMGKLAALVKSYAHSSILEVKGAQQVLIRAL